MDEAFKSRIHISLYFPALNRRTTLEVWKVNLRRLKRLGEQQSLHVDVDKDEILKFAKHLYKDRVSNRSSAWNGRQIRNPFQTALSLAEREAATGDMSYVKLRAKHFELVAMTSQDFDQYLLDVMGGLTDADMAMMDGVRSDKWSAEPIDERPTKARSTPGRIGGAGSKSKSKLYVKSDVSESTESASEDSEYNSDEVSRDKGGTRTARKSKP